MNNQNGFSLIELLIVVAIIGIIAAIAYPSYVSTVQTSRRTDAQAALQQFVQAMERFRAIRYTYEGAADGGVNAGFPASNVFAYTHSPFDGAVKFYELRVNAMAPNRFTVTATPINGQVSDRCGTMSIDQAGVKTVSSSTVAECWK